jgi:hypothetical protein
MRGGIWKFWSCEQKFCCRLGLRRNVLEFLYAYYAWYASEWRKLAEEPRDRSNLLSTTPAGKGMFAWQEG